jgi:hypothetical protein
VGLRRNVFVEPEPPPFDIRLERVRRKAAVLAAEIELRDAAQKLKDFQGKYYSMNGTTGQLVPKVSIGVVDNFAIDQEHARLVRTMSLSHDKFQTAVRSYAEIAP